MPEPRADSSGAQSRCVLVVCLGRAAIVPPAITVGLLMIFGGLRLTEAAADVVRCRGRVLSNMDLSTAAGNAGLRAAREGLGCGGAEAVLHFLASTRHHV
jgi:hypothetical protein